MTPLMTKDEVAAYLGLNPKTLDVWAHQRKGPPFIRVEGARRYDRDDLKAWIEERKVRH